jgi:AmmeMemoRadiSam system protein B
MHEIDNLNTRDKAEYPCIRSVEAIPADTEKGQMILLRDSSNISMKTLLVSPATLYILSLFDGKRSVNDIQVACSRKFGEFITTNSIRDLIFELDTALFLNSDRFRKYKEFLETEFKKSKFREWAHAGASYPEDPIDLQESISDYFQELPIDLISETPIGIISPHIDFQRGNRTYAAAYRQLAKTDADTFVIIGTSHHPVKNYIALCDKIFKTPLGDLKPDSDLINRIAKKCKFDVFADEFRHRDEHSIEFQTIFLKYLFPYKDIKIIPILVGHFEDLHTNGIDLNKDENLTNFIDSFNNTLIESNCKPMYITGADFSHIGPYFGDPAPPTLIDMRQLEEEEIINLKYLEKADSEGYFNKVAIKQEKNRVCGLSAIYLMLKLMKPQKGQLLEYRQCSDPKRINNVTIAAMTFYSSL